MDEIITIPAAEWKRREREKKTMPMKWHAYSILNASMQSWMHLFSTCSASLFSIFIIAIPPRFFFLRNFNAHPSAVSSVQLPCKMRSVWKSVKVNVDWKWEIKMNKRSYTFTTEITTDGNCSYFRKLSRIEEEKNTSQHKNVTDLSKPLPLPFLCCVYVFL